MCRLSLAAFGIMTMFAAALLLASSEARADSAAETGMGVVYGDTEMAASVCPGLVLDLAARADLMAGKGVDPSQPSDAFKRGVSEADQRASEAIANERLRSFCLEMSKAYGVNGTSVPGLLQAK